MYKLPKEYENLSKDELLKEALKLAEEIDKGWRNAFASIDEAKAKEYDVSIDDIRALRKSQKERFDELINSGMSGVDARRIIAKMEP